MFKYSYFLRCSICISFSTFQKHSFILGLTPSTFEPHAVYLEDLHNTVIAKVTDLMEKHLHQKNNNTTLPSHSDGPTCQLFKEVLIHSYHHRKITKECRARGFEGIEDKIKNMITKNNGTEHKVIALEGPEASGKTVLSSKVAAWASEHLEQDCVVVLRYIGLTSLSSSESTLLMNICCQLEYNLKGTMDCLFLKLDGLTRYLGEILNCYNKSGKTVLVILDGIENVNSNGMPNEEQPSLEWLFIDLPPFVHFVITVNNTASQISKFDKCFQRIKDLESRFEVPSLSENSLHQVLKDGFAGSNRKLTAEQENIIVDVCKTKGIPFHLKLCVDEALFWPSFAASDSFSSKFASTLDIAINHRFDKLEEKYGEKVVGKVCLYLSTSYSGVSETELLDILSCDNEIIELLFKHRDIANEFTVLRFPSNLLWGMRTDFGCCISDRYLHGKRLLVWSHVMIAQTAKHRYHPSVEDTKQAHGDFANLFLEKWLGNKPLVNPEKGLEIIDTGNRFVSYQPLLYSDTKYNHRRINTLWFHLLHSGKLHLFIN